MALLPLLFAVALQGQTVAPSTTVPFRIAENAIIVDAVVNGRNVSLMFDTGFASAVNVSDNVNLGKPTGVAHFRDFVRTFEVPSVKITSMKFGDKSLDTTGLSDAGVVPEDFSFAYGTHCDGLMGFEVIKNNITGINFEHSKFEIYPPTLDISKWVPDNKRTFLIKLLPTGLSSLEMPVETPTGKHMILALDTGNAYYATTYREVLERVGMWDGTTTPKYMSQSMVGSGAIDSWSIKLDGMKVFGVSVPSAVWDVIDLPSSSASGDGTVGFGFLHNFNIIIDYERRRVWLENYSGKTSDDPPGDIGIGAVGDPRSGEVRIYRITPNSPAEKAGIKAGDSVLSLDGEDLDGHVGYRKMQRMLRGPVGSKVKLAISSGGALKRIELERAALYNEVPK
jgi:hypothetical protein